MSRLGPPIVPGWDFWKLYDDGEWEPETKEVLSRFLYPGSIFVDIGAWIGPVTMWALELGADVIAIEPDPVAFEMLKHNAPEAKCLPAAIGATTGLGTLQSFAPDSWGDSQSRLVEGDDADGKDVITLAPSVILCMVKPTLIKVDVEGGETRILPELVGASNCPLYISWHQPWFPEPVGLEDRQSWFADYTCEPIRGDGWTGFSELLAVPK